MLSMNLLRNMPLLPERLLPERSRPHITLDRADVIPLELSWTKLARAICKALNLNSKFANLPIPNTGQIGTWSADAVPAILTIQTEMHHLRHVIAELIVTLRQKFRIVMRMCSKWMPMRMVLAATGPRAVWVTWSRHHVPQSGFKTWSSHVVAGLGSPRREQFPKGSCGGYEATLVTGTPFRCPFSQRV